MDAVSLETPQENEFIKQRIARGDDITIVTIYKLYSEFSRKFSHVVRLEIMGQSSFIV
jgi:hypothetical protein